MNRNKYHTITSCFIHKNSGWIRTQLHTLRASGILWICYLDVRHFWYAWLYIVMTIMKCLIKLVNSKYYCILLAFHNMPTVARTCRLVSVWISQMRNTRAVDSDMICWSFSLHAMSTMVKRCPISLPVGREKMWGCHTRITLSTPPVAMMLARAQ